MPNKRADLPLDAELSASALHLAASIRQGRLSSEELTRACLQRIESINPEVNAIVSLRAEDALAEARVADEAVAKKIKLGPLHGVPMTLKDSIDTTGLTTTYGTLGRKNHIPAHDATIVTRLKKAGAILLGKTNTPEFTLSFETDNLVYGRTINPFDPARSPGGSSGGAAAAVTTGMSPFDIGSDTGGSIRFPSHCCGTTGLKPTSGRVPRTGHAISFSGIHQGFTQLGPIARSVGDLELLLRIISGPDGVDPYVHPVPLPGSSETRVKNLRIAWHADNGMYSPTTEIQSTTRDAAMALADCGARVTELVPCPLTTGQYAFGELLAWNCDGGAWIQRLLNSAGTIEAHPGTLSQIDPSCAVASGELSRLLENRQCFRSDMLIFMEDYDALISPASGFPAPVYGETEDEKHHAGYSYTWLHNITGWPAAVVRCGTSPEGLPIGVQVAARPWREDIVLAVAQQLETIFGGWKPPFGA